MTTTDWRARGRSAPDVAAIIPRTARVFVHGAAATPPPPLDALSARTDLDDVALYHLHLGGPAAFVDRRTPGLLSYSLFTGPALRQRAEALIALAHPDVRGELRREANALRHWAM